ncbi:MAG: hypothetical protein MAG551_01240 [Candidatus Scalindua arabica]|uniref:Uncharacterized protein n=1 Tax=Candidatus Scalindua arabica TaxID=1127984 RepID=A0A941W2X4_9BACT|nr:hypothetical protein [Candidatus Scalindua arabica]
MGKNGDTFVHSEDKFYGRHFLNSLPDCKKVSDIKDIKHRFSLVSKPP